LLKKHLFLDKFFTVLLIWKVISQHLRTENIFSGVGMGFKKVQINFDGFFKG